MGAVAAHLSREGPPDPEAVRSMLRAAPHRGGCEVVESVGRVTLGVCHDPDWIRASLARRDGWIAAFHGNLDNDAELRDALRGEGAREPENATPAGTLLAGWAHWKDGVFGRLRGSYTAVVTDGREILCVRDHFGTRPLFHHDGPGGFFVATEVKQVLAAAPIPREPDLDHLHRVLYGGVGRSTGFRGVERIPARMIARAGREPGLRPTPYWEPRSVVETIHLDPEAAAEGTREHLGRAVSRMLSGDDVLLLSGGLDSPAVAAFAARPDLARNPVKGLTSVYPDHPSVDEREWTKMAADHVGMDLDEFAATAGALDDVEEWMGLVEGPVPALSIPESAEAYREARSRGGRTVLTGEIAEILFESRAYLLDHLLWHGRFGPAAGMIRDLYRAGRSRRRILADLIRAVTPPRLLPKRLRPTTHARLEGLPEWVDGETLVSYGSGSGKPRWRTSPRKRWRDVQTAAFTGASSGFEADEICATACGVDVRRPFADVDLWEFVLSLPAEVKFPDRSTKPLLRRAMRGVLPEALIDRKDKTYFDEFHLSTADYATMTRLLVDSPHRMDGIDYELLGARLETREMELYELMWAQLLARVHAFLDQW